MPLVAGIDSSTQSTKVRLLDVDRGELVGFGRAMHPPVTHPRSEQDPDAWWLALATAMAQAVAAAATGGARPGDIAALAVAGQQHGMVVLDRHGEVIRPAKLWNDVESAPDAARLVDELGADRWAQACGSVPLAAFTITKLAWLRHREPDSFARIARVLLPHDWLTHRLTGAFTTDRGDASGTGYWSAADGRYRFDLLALVDADRDWASSLPTVLGPWDQAGVLGVAAADHLGLRPGIPVAAGTGDNMAGALGLGLRHGDVAISLGTSGTVFARSDRPTHDPSGAVAGFADATGSYLPLVCTLNATLVTETFARLLGVDHAGLDALALAAPAGAEGVTLVPYLAGERTPNRPDATGTLAGLRPDASRECVARAAFEGVACGLLDGLDALGDAGVAVDGGRLLLIGGGARSDGFRRVIADLADRSLRVPSTDEVVATGAAVQAAAMLAGGGCETIADRWGLSGGTTVEPSADSAAAVTVRRRYAAARG